MTHGVAEESLGRSHIHVTSSSGAGDAWCTRFCSPLSAGFLGLGARAHLCLWPPHPIPKTDVRLIKPKLTTSTQGKCNLLRKQK